MANIFPMGLVANGSSTGTISGIAGHTLFEPNMRCSSSDMHNILVSQFEQQTRSTRKKANPYITVTYEYENIFNREYAQIEHFVNTIGEGGLNSFYVVDFARGQSPTNVTDGATNWQVDVDNTRYYANEQIYTMIRSPKYGFKAGPYTAIDTNTSVTINQTDTTWGSLTLANAVSDGTLYPMYKMYFTPSPLAGFKTTYFVNEPMGMAATQDGGFMRSGTITFVSFYPSV